MQETLGDKVTGWAIYALQTFGTLPYGFQVEPFVSDKEADRERLVVKVEIGPQLLEADQCFSGNITFTLKTTRREADLAKDLWARVEDCLTQGLMNPDSNQQALATFSRLDFLTEDAQVDISNTPNTRKFVRTIPLHVKLL